MVSTSISEVSAEPETKWARSEWFGMPGRSARPPQPEAPVVPELECMSSAADKLVQSVGSREALTGQLRAKRVA